MKYTKRAMLFSCGSVGSLIAGFIPGMNPSVAEQIAVRGFIIFFSLFLIFGTVDLIRALRNKSRGRAETDAQFR